MAGPGAWENFIPGDTYNRPSRCGQYGGAHRYLGLHGDGELELALGREAFEDRNAVAALVEQSLALVERYRQRPSAGLMEGFEP